MLSGLHLRAILLHFSPCFVQKVATGVTTRLQPSYLRFSHPSVSGTKVTKPSPSPNRYSVFHAHCSPATVPQKWATAHWAHQPDSLMNCDIWISWGSRWEMLLPDANRTTLRKAAFIMTCKCLRASCSSSQIKPTTSWIGGYAFWDLYC